MILSGKKTVSGVAIGEVFLLKEMELKIEEGTAPAAATEISRLEHSLEKAREELKEIHSKVSLTIGSEEAEIIEAHLMMLEDPDFIDSIHSKINGQKFFATKALHETSAEMALIFEGMDSDYMKQRAHDIRDISSRVMQALNGFSGKIELSHQCIIVARELKPSVLSSLDHKKIAGIISTVDGRNSHTAILARSLEIPTLMGASGIHQKVVHGEMLAFNADEEQIFLNPSQDELKKSREALEKWQKNKKELLNFKNIVSEFKGERVSLEANVNSLTELPGVNAYGADGIGLFRTEFIYMDRSSAPSEDEQVKIYTEVLKSVHPKPCTIRTLDVGGDKDIPYLNIGTEENPFLGLRAIRYCLRNPDFFKTQLRALLRASVVGNLKIMIPMITNLNEVLQTRELLKEVESELKTKGVAFAPYKLGIMVEVPAVAITAQEFAPHVDFFSIGTNDLTQYTCAVDRMNENIRNLYDSGHPAVLALIGNTIKAAREFKIGVSVCGEMAGQVNFTQSLLDLGLRSFSMSASQILTLRKNISLK